MTHTKEQVDNRPSTPGLPKGRQWQRAAILLTVLIGFTLRFYRLDFQELGPLEGLVFGLRQFSFSDLTHLFLVSGQPLLLGSYWLQNVWHSLTGSTEFALRSISALCSSLAVVLVFRFAKEMQLSTFVVLAATLLMALNSSAISSTQSGLFHSLSLALTAASAVLALRISDGGGSRRALFAYVICTAATFYIHVYAALPLLAQNLYVLYLLVRDRRTGEGASTARPARSLLQRWSVSQFAIGALCAPWLISAWPTIADFTTRAPASFQPPPLLLGYGRVTVGIAVPEGIWLQCASLFAIVIITAAVIGPIFAARRESERRDKGANAWIEFIQQEDSEAQKVRPRYRGNSPTVLLLLYLLASLLTYWSPHHIYPVFFGSDYALFIAPFLLLLAMGLANIGGWVDSWLGSRWKVWTEGADAGAFKAIHRIGIGNLAAVSLILLIVAGHLFSIRNFHFAPAFSKTRGLNELAEMLERLSTGLDPAEVRFAEIFPDLAFWDFYYTGEVEYISLPPWPKNLEGALDAVNGLRSTGVKRISLLVRREKDQEETDIGMQAVASRLGWESPSQGQTHAQTTEFARQALASSYQLAGQESVGPWLVELYARPDPQLWRLLNVKFANGLTLERAQVSPDFPPAGGRLVVHTEWSGDPAALTGGEKLFLHLLDESGNLVAQWDPEFRMDSSQVLTSVAMPIPPNIPVGPLRLIAGLYDVNTESAPRILTESGEESLLLVFFQVTECDACGR